MKKKTDTVIESNNDLEKDTTSKQTQNIEPQVKAVVQKTMRRHFSSADKLKLIKAFEACTDASERGAFLRKNGLYYSSITKWKKALSGKNTYHANSKAYKTMRVNNQLQRENTKLKRQLAQAEAIIELQKKVSELLSMSVLDHEVSETKS